MYYSIDINSTVDAYNSVQVQVGVSVGSYRFGLGL